MTGEVEDRAAEAAALEKAEKEEAAAFAVEFKGVTKSVEPEPKSAVEPAAPVATVGLTEDLEVTDKNIKDGKLVDAPEPKPAVEKPAPPKYVRVTEQQLADMLAAADKVKDFGPKSLKQAIDKIGGDQGGLKQAIEKIQSETARGQKFDPAALEELKKDYPELAGHLEKILGGLKGTGAEAPPKPATATADKPASTDADEIKRLAREETFKEELTELATDYPDWEKIVGASDKPDQKNLFRVWLKTKPQEYQDRVNNTLSPRVIAREIDRFKAATATPRQPQAPAKPAKNPAAAARRNVVANAVTPKTAGGQPAATVKTEQDYFREAFRERSATS